jgi:hypothetical protein
VNGENDPARWRVLEDDRALTMPEWLPTEDVAPELAELREQHLRLLAAQKDAAKTGGDLRRAYEGEDERYQQALQSAATTGSDLGSVVNEATPPEVRTERLREADQRLAATNDALLAFCLRAVEEVKERAPELYSALAARVDAAEAKRDEARRLLEEADLAVRATMPLRNWLDRTTGRTTMVGHYPFGMMEIPPAPEQIDWAGVLGGGSVMEVEHA